MAKRSKFECQVDALVEAARLDETPVAVHRWDPEGGDAAYAAWQADDRMGAESEDDYVVCPVCTVRPTVLGHNDRCEQCWTDRALNA